MVPPGRSLAGGMESPRLLQGVPCVHPHKWGLAEQSDKAEPFEVEQYTYFGMLQFYDKYSHRCCPLEQRNT